MGHTVEGRENDVMIIVDEDTNVITVISNGVTVLTLTKIKRFSQHFLPQKAVDNLVTFAVTHEPSRD